MAYRRRHSMPRDSTFEEFRSGSGGGDGGSPTSLAARAMRASAAHRDSSSLSSAYGEVVMPSDSFARCKAHTSPKDTPAHEYTSMESINESKHGFWGIVARKAKSMLEDDTNDEKNHDQFFGGAQYPTYQPLENYQKKEGPVFKKKSDALASSLNKFRSALEEGLTMMENKTADIIQETRKFHANRKGNSPDFQCQPAQDKSAPNKVTQSQVDPEAQLKATRDVANKMAAKAKVLLRELKAVKVDLAFMNGRCRQLEEENKGLREKRDKGSNPEEDDMIRLQLETLLSEKAKLAHENSMYARENRFLREIVEYHQPASHDVIYLDEDDVQEEEDFDKEQEKAEQHTISMPSPSPSPASKQLQSTTEHDKPAFLAADVENSGSQASPNTTDGQRTLP